MEEDRKIKCLDNNDHAANVGVGVIVLLIFGVFSFSVFARFFCIVSKSGFDEALKIVGDTIVFALIFAAIDFIALINVFRPAMKRRATLVDINYMDDKYELIFELDELYYLDSQPVFQRVRCFVKDPEFLKIGEQYSLVYNKSDSQQIDEILENPFEADISAPSIEKQAVDITLALIAVVPAGGILIGVYALFKYPQYWHIYLIVIICFVIWLLKLHRMTTKK